MPFRRHLRHARLQDFPSSSATPMFGLLPSALCRVSYNKHKGNNYIIDQVNALFYPWVQSMHWRLQRLAVSTQKWSLHPWMRNSYFLFPPLNAITAADVLITTFGRPLPREYVATKC